MTLTPGMHVDGVTRPGSGEVGLLVSPATDEPFADIAQSSTEDVHAATASAAAASGEWAALTAGERARMLLRLADLKQFAEGPKKAKVNASPSAQQFCRDNGLDITKVTGTGTEGKVLLKDVKDLKPTAKADSDDDDTSKRKISSAAAKLMKRYEIDEEDIVEVEGTGTNGTVVAKDLKELIDLIKAEKSDDSDSGEDDE